MNDKITIKSNRHERPLYGLADLTPKDAEDFDYIEGEDRYSPRLFNYRGSWYDYYEFQRTSERLDADGWDGIQTESYFSGVLVSYRTKEGKLLDETVIVGYAHW